MNTIEDFYQFGDENKLTDLYMQVLFAQAKHETKNFISNVYINAKNLFGMRIAGSRSQNNIGELATASGVYAIYNSTRDSLIDRINLDFYNKVAPPKDLEDVYRYVAEVAGHGYATDPDYIPLWSNHIRTVLLDQDYSESETLSIFDKAKKIGVAVLAIVAVIGYLIAAKKIKLPFKIPFINS